MNDKHEKAVAALQTLSARCRRGDLPAETVETVARKLNLRPSLVRGLRSFMSAPDPEQAATLLRNRLKSIRPNLERGVDVPEQDRNQEQNREL